MALEFATYVTVKYCVGGCGRVVLRPWIGNRDRVVTYRGVEIAKQCVAV